DRRSRHEPGRNLHRCAAVRADYARGDDPVDLLPAARPRHGVDEGCEGPSRLVGRAAPLTGAFRALDRSLLALHPLRDFGGRLTIDAIEPRPGELVLVIVDEILEALEEVAPLEAARIAVELALRELGVGRELARERAGQRQFLVREQ